MLTRAFDNCEIPTRTPLEEVEQLSGLDAEKLSHIPRKIIYAAMDKYKASNGRMGLGYFVHDGGSHRFVRRASIRRWLESLEKRACYA